ncbi:hypothetical protein Fmac_027415 [Flemingia macrophylla]|uniref:GIR1-like zinc ribbon domain-containing protein n=1 Tax=Flemingia macrophylla TaxID=520843 RepID=A0ABD1LHP4_9FABA
MSDRNEGKPKLELRLNLSPPRVFNHRPASPTLPTIMSSTSPPNSSGYMKVKQEEEDNNVNNNDVDCSNNPEVVPLVLIGCPRCLMYILVPKDNLMCPKCKSTNFIKFFRDNNNINNNPIIMKRE